MILRGHGYTAVAGRTPAPRRAGAPAAAAAASRTNGIPVAAAAARSPLSPAAAANRDTTATAVPSAVPPAAASPSPPSPPTYVWQTDAQAQAQARAKIAADPRVRAVPLASIRRPLARSRTNDPEKVAALAASIDACGLLLEPIDVLEAEDGALYGFSGCHRYEAHVVLGRETILCRVRKATVETLKAHLR